MRRQLLGSKRPEPQAPAHQVLDRELLETHLQPRVLVQKAREQTRASPAGADHEKMKQAVTRWLRRHPRCHLHFIPTRSSWLNLVERWFGEITQRRIRRGTFRSVKGLTTAIPTRSVWTKDADMILDKVRRCEEALGTPH